MSLTHSYINPNLFLKNNYLWMVLSKKSLFFQRYFEQGETKKVVGVRIKALILEFSAWPMPVYCCTMLFKEIV